MAASEASPASSGEGSGSELESSVEGEARETGWRKQRCTDVFCIPLFACALAALGYILHYASIHGDMARVFHGIDFHSNVCGVSEAVKNKSYLFWCAKPGNAMTVAAMQAAGLTPGMGVSVMSLSDHLDIEHPICVSSCPNSSETFSSCYQRDVVTNGPKDATGTFTRTIKYEYDLVADHPTTPIASRYCMPRNLDFLDELQSTMNGGMEGFMFHASEVIEDWPLIAASAALAILLGYVYLFLVKCLARPLLYMTLAVSSLGCLIFGASVLAGAHDQDSLSTFANHLKINTTKIDAALARNNITMTDLYVPSTGDKRVDVAIAVAAILLGLGIAIAACCMRRTINLVIGSIAATLECLQDMPIMLLQPLVGAILRTLYLSLAFLGFVWVVSIGDVASYDVSSYVPAGFARTFSYEGDEIYYVAGYLLVALWVLEFLAALDQFVFIYGTMMWFFAPYTSSMGMRRKSVSQCAMLRGFCVGLTFHFGTLAFGSAILALMRFLYFVLSMVYRQAKASTGGESNAVVNAAAGCCMCCLQCWEKIVRYFNKMAYIVVCMNSQNFCSAAGTVVEIVASEFAALGLLETATKFFQAGGIIAITGAGGGLTWLLLTNLETFNSLESPHFVPQPEYVAGAAAVVSLVVAASFMEVFGTVSDTILFSWALDKRNREKRGMPPNEQLPRALQRLLPTGRAGEQEKLVS